ncbi:hypothetical protein F5884DRAFT_848582 [Xylogone sp. PMI_703]|nr:hypothetical protein F5884DRAFT_848582 [Xylogone sp. PMI_703]
MDDIYASKGEAMKIASLRLLPVLSSTASTMVAISEIWTILPFLKPSIEENAVTTWFDNWLYYSLPGAVGLGLTSTIAGYLGWKNTGGGARFCYGWGTVLAVGHFVFGPTIARGIERLVHKPSQPKAGVRTWLKIHTIRTVVTDIPAMIFFLGGFLHL